MADTEISKLPPLSQAGLRGEDVLAIADVSQVETKKIRADALVAGAIGTLPPGVLDPDAIDWDGLTDGTIDGSKIKPCTYDLCNGDVSTGTIQNGAVTEDKLASGAVTADKTNFAEGSINGNVIIDGTIGPDQLEPDLPGSILENGAIDTLQLASGAVETDKINSGAVTEDKLASGAVTDAKVTDVSGDKIIDATITADKFDPDAFGGGITVNATPQVVHENDLGAAGSQNGISFDRHGHIIGTQPLASTDLPIATDTTLGAVIVPGGSGLEVDANGNLDHSNDITAGTYGGIQFDEHGHITGLPADGQIPSTNLPIAGDTAAELGAVYVPVQDSLVVESDGAVRHTTIPGVAGTHAKVTVNSSGHVTGGSTLTANDIPNLSADKITSGQFPTDRIEDEAITAAKLDDYSTCLMQEDVPVTSDDNFLGRFWYTPSTAQLRVFGRGSGPENIWLPVGFGALTQQNLRVGFTYNATNGTVVTITSYGANVGLTVGGLVPDPTDALTGIYGVCVVSGNSLTQHDLTGTVHNPGDWILCLGETQGWVHVDVNEGTGGGGGGGAQILNDLLDVTIDQTRSLSGGNVLPAVALEDGQILKYEAATGQWINTYDSSSVVVGDTPPSPVEAGTLWFDSESGQLFIAYEDDDSTQWVPTTPVNGGVPVSGLLNDLDDVNAIPQGDAAFLVWDTGTNQWVATQEIDCGVY